MDDGQPAQNLRDVLQMVWEMIEDAQQAANAAHSDFWRERLLAQRDALTELRLRIRDGKCDRHWLRRMRRELMHYMDHD